MGGVRELAGTSSRDRGLELTKLHRAMPFGVLIGPSSAGAAYLIEVNPGPGIK